MIHPKRDIGDDIFILDASIILEPLLDTILRFFYGPRYKLSRSKTDEGSSVFRISEWSSNGFGLGETHHIEKMFNNSIDKDAQTDG